MVHFGSHEMRFRLHRAEFYRVLSFLLEFFFDTAETVERLEERRKELEALHTGMDSPEVDFSGE